MSISVTVTGLSDIGQARSRNEDSLEIRSSLGIAVVTDGLGGHPNGDLASRLATEAVAMKLVEFVESDGVPTSSVHAMREALMLAHDKIRTQVAENSELEGMGTTVTAILIEPSSESYTLGHAEDSRAYQPPGRHPTPVDNG